MNATRTILIIDRDTALIAPLYRLFHQMKWKILTATHFPQGSELLQQHEVSLVIAGLQDVEGRKGTAFLEQVKDQYPGAIRLLLTDDVSEQEVVRGLAEGLFHEVIPVSWNSQELRDILLRAFQGRTATTEKGGLQPLLDQIGPLPVQPQIYQQVRRELQKRESASTDRIAKLISQDPAMTAEILRVANAAFFGQRQRVDTVNRAIVVLGLDLAAHLILFLSVYQAMPPQLPEFGYEAFWAHSLGVGLAASSIRARNARDSRVVERAMVGGLLHDLGKLAFACYLPDPYARVLATARTRKASLETVEIEQLGASHAELGGHLAEQWRLPPSIVASIRWHHDPASSGQYRPFVALVQLADEMVRHSELGFSGNFQEPNVEQYADQRPRVRTEDMDRAHDELVSYQETGKFLLTWR